MTLQELDILLLPETRRAIRDNIDREPGSVAADKRLPNARLVATQVKYLQKARTKLPSWYAAQCVIPPLAFEQASSEQTALHKEFSGEVCVDLTCGLGVDSFALSKRFNRVIAYERDPVLAAVARMNFEMLGIRNIEVHRGSAEDAVAHYCDNAKNKRIDLIYVDPDRRSSQGRKMVTLAGCSPDLTTMLPRLREIADRIVVKLSPMFDVAEVFRIFGPHTIAEVVSLAGECKEVVVFTSQSIPYPAIRATVIGGGSVEYPYESGKEQRIDPEISDAATLVEQFQWLVVPDAALVKARVAARYFTEAGAYIEKDDTFALLAELPDTEFMPGRVYRIDSFRKYVPKKLKAELKKASIGRLNIIRRGFPLSAAQIAASLGVQQGGDRFMAFAVIGGTMFAIMLTPR